MATWFAMLIETDEDAAASASRELEDPKHILRHELATRGVVTQFISATSAPRSSSNHEFADRISDATVETAHGTFEEHIPKILDFVARGGRGAFRSSSSTQRVGRALPWIVSGHFYSIDHRKCSSTL